MGAFFIKQNINYIDNEYIHLTNGRKFKKIKCIVVSKKYYPLNAQIINDGLIIDNTIVNSNGVFHVPKYENVCYVEVLDEFIE